MFLTLYTKRKECVSICIAHSSFLCMSQGNDQSFDLPVKKKSDICTIMYTSGTTGDPKGVLISNESIITLLAAIKQLLACCKEQVSIFLLSLLFLAIIWISFHLSKHFGLLIWMLLKCCFLFAVAWERCIPIIPSTCTHLWQDCWGSYDMARGFNWFLAWGEYI